MEFAVTPFRFREGATGHRGSERVVAEHTVFQIAPPVCSDDMSVVVPLLRPRRGYDPRLRELVYLTVLVVPRRRSLKERRGRLGQRRWEGHARGMGAGASRVGSESRSQENGRPKTGSSSRTYPPSGRPDALVKNVLVRSCAGLEQHPLAVTEILATQVVGFCPLTHKTLADLGYHHPSGCAP